MGRGYQVVEADTHTGSRKRLDTLTHAVNASEKHGHWRLSPDGKWLFWPEPEVWRFISTDGSLPTVSRPVPDKTDWNEFPQFAWMPDSRGWVALVHRHASTETNRHSATEQFDFGPETVGALDAVTGSLDAPGTIHRLRNLAVLHGARDWDVESPRAALLGITSKQEVTVLLNKEGSNACTLLRFDPATAQPIFRKHPFQLPAGYLLQAVVISPRGDRLAWQLVPLENLENPRECHLWTSDANGDQLHRLGIVNISNVMPWGDARGVTGLAWTPDGKGLSYIHDGALHVMEAN